MHAPKALKAKRNAPCDIGRDAGQQIARLCQPAIDDLAADGEPDERCKSCAFRAGTFPNQCAATVADALKATMEDVPFLCHQPPKNGLGVRDFCHGWFALRVQMKKKGIANMAMPYDFSDAGIKALYGHAIFAKSYRAAVLMAAEVGLTQNEWIYAASEKDLLGIDRADGRAVFFGPDVPYRAIEARGLVIGWPEVPKC